MKIKLGNDINFTWNVYRDGEPEDWTGKVIEVKLLSPHKTECVITNIDHSTQGVITFTYLGMNQTIYGDYTAVLYENNGDEGMVAVDAVKAVTLVRHSYQTSAAQDSTIITDSVILEGSITAIPSTPFTQIQANWDETDSASPAYILHKPDLTVFVTNTALATTLTDYVTNNVLSITLADYVTNTALSTALSDYVTSATLATALTNYVQKSQTAGLLKNDGTVDTTQYLSQHQDISGKADKSEMSVVPGTGTDADKTTIILKQGTSATVLTAHQDISSKEDITPIEAVASGTTAITAEVNKYYEVAGTVSSLTVTLPTPTTNTEVTMVVVHLTVGASPTVVVTSVNEVVKFSAAYSVVANKEYELSCLYNGSKWIVSSMEVAV